MSRPERSPELSIVVPVYFNAESLEELYARLAAAMSDAGVSRWDVTFVDDGSRDHSPAVLEQIRRDAANVRVLRLSRNFGSMAAIAAGLQHARGRCVAVIAADLQDPPELLADMVERWRAGAKVVLAARESRQDPPLTRLFSALFYRVFRLAVSSEMPAGGFDFFLIDAQVARLLVEHGEKNTNLSAALLWLGFRREIIGYHRGQRPCGQSRWTFPKKVKYMYDSVLSFSYLPLRLMTGAGVLGMMLAALYGLLVIFDHIRNGGARQPGWASLMVVTLFFSAMTLSSIGLVGEYVWRTFDAARARPEFVVEECAESTQLSGSGGDEDQS